MPERSLPPLPTTVVGSYALPSWLWAAHEKIQAGGFAEMDIAETENDAVDMAIRDQERADVDVISDGEMRRQGFIVSIFGSFTGLRPIPPRRKIGILSYDGHTHYEPVDRIRAPAGLGMRKELGYLRGATARPFKLTCPGPLTLATQITPGGPYRSRLEVAAELAGIINAELRALAADGARYLQLDDVYQSFAMKPGTLVDLYNQCVEGVKVDKLFYHICFGTLEGFSISERSYRPLFPTLLEVKADQLVFEFANRELSEIDLCREFGQKELGGGVIDTKSFYIEKPEVVARRIRRLLEHLPAARLWVNPDCGLARMPRHLAFAKLQALVEGTRIVRRELTGQH